MERNEDGTVGAEHITDEGVALQPEPDIDATEMVIGLAQLLSNQYAPAIHDLYDKIDTLSEVLATVITIVAENAEQPHTMAEELRSLLAIPEADAEAEATP